MVYEPVNIAGDRHLMLEAGHKIAQTSTTWEAQIEGQVTGNSHL